MISNRPSPVLLVVLYGDAGTPKAVACGPAGDLIAGLNLDQLDRICAATLTEPDRHTALRTLERLLNATADLVDRLGLVLQTAPEPLPPITEDDIHLMCWIAIVPEPVRERAGSAARPR
ncbi:hypothetical protein [Streptosporangium subroseum]|uniref:hypothetical protein n=1 Tax=Streptosporangium subroseum TaxID=106412 RepID=UPI0030901686|nr:hypothetical protein OHB15_14315 [Streptosporangium subroseum]